MSMEWGPGGGGTTGIPPTVAEGEESILTQPLQVQTASGWKILVVDQQAVRVISYALK